MLDAEQHQSAIQAANLSLSGRRRRDGLTQGTPEAPLSERQAGPWEVAAVAAVGAATLTLVLGIWFLR